MADFRLDGAEQMKRKIRALASRFPARIDRALKLRAEGVMTRSKNEFVPVAPDGGNLKSSGFVGDPERSGDGRDVSITLGFGGPSAPYAIAIHEHPSEASPPSWKGKELKFHLGNKVGVKYLERPLMEAVGTLASDLADDLDVDKL